MVRSFQIRFHGAFELLGHGVAVAVGGLAEGYADPAFADAVFLDIGFLGAVEADADAAFEQGLVEIRAGRVGAETVGEGVVGHLGSDAGL